MHCAVYMGWDNHDEGYNEDNHTGFSSAGETTYEWTLDEVSRVS